VNSMKIRFADLPERGSSSPVGRGGKGKHGDIANQLRKAPGQWAHIDTRPSGSAAACMGHQIRTAYYKAYAPKGTFEAVGRTVNGEHHVYARYIGEDGEYA
jgi:hypothetical protein